MPIRHYTSRGEVWDFTTEAPPTISLTSILLTLSREKRFANETVWTVLEHSLAVGWVAKQLYDGNHPLIQYAYCHDFQEAVVRDVPTPIKQRAGIGYQQVEDEIQRKIFKSFGMDANISADDKRLVHEIDQHMAYVEACTFFHEHLAKEIGEKMNVNPYIVVQCTQALLAVRNSRPLNEDGSMNQWVVDTYKDGMSNVVD